MANKPTNPSLWSKAKSLARQKFDVYPSAYANGWAAKWYKGKGGGWRKAAHGGSMIEDTEIAYQYGGDPSIPNLNYSDMYSYATGGVPNNRGFEALPEKVKRMIIANMKKRYGGPSSMGYYQGDMGPSTVDMYMTPPGFGEMAYGPEYAPGQMSDTYSQSMASYVPPARYVDSSMGPVPAAALQQYQAAIAAPAQVVKRGVNPYQGVSVVDFLNTQGVASDYATRKQLAQTLGMTNYRGTAAQNQQLISAVINNPDILNTVAGVKASKKKAVSEPIVYVDPESGTEYTQSMIDDINQGLIADARKWSKQPAPSPITDTTGAVKDTTGAGMVVDKKTGKKEAPTNYSKEVMVSLLGASGAVYLINKLGKDWVATNGKFVTDLAKAGLSADDIVNAAKAGGRTEETLNLLRARGMNMPDALKALKGVKFKTAAADVSPEVLKGTEAAVSRIKNLVETEEKARKQAQLLVQYMRDRGVRDPKTMAKIEKLIPNTAQRMKMLKGIPMPKPGAVTQGLRTASKLAKFLRFAEGGSYNPFMPMYQGDEGSSEYEGDIEFDQYNPDPEPWWVEVLDPTGYTSWDDVQRAYNDPNLSWWEKGLEYAGAIPVVGKIGKGAKAVNEAAKVVNAANKTSKAKRVGKAIAKGAAKTADWVSGAAPLRYVQSLPFTPTGLAAAGLRKGLANYPRVAGGVDFLGDAARSTRFWNSVGEVARGRADAKTILQSSPEEMVKMYLDDGSIIQVGTHDPFFSEIVSKNAMDTTADRFDPETGAFRLDTSKFSGPRDWQAVRKKYKMKKKGGDVSGTYSAGVFYPDGGTFIPTYGDMAYGALPEYGMGSGYMNMYQGDMGSSSVATQMYPLLSEKARRQMEIEDNLKNSLLSEKARRQMQIEANSILSDRAKRQMELEAGTMLPASALLDSNKRQMFNQQMAEQMGRRMGKAAQDAMYQRMIDQQMRNRQLQQLNEGFPILPMIDPTGASDYKYGGIAAGQEMYVTPEEMEALRQQGYEFDIM